MVDKIEDIATNVNGKRFIHVCCCRHHNCDFTDEGLDSIIPKCSSKCNGCDSIRSEAYEPKNLSRNNLENMQFGEELKEEIRNSDYLRPLKEKLNL